MSSQVAGKAIIHNKDQKKVTMSHSTPDHGVHTRGKLLPRQKHVPLHCLGVQPNGDPTEVMLWGDL